MGTGITPPNVLEDAFSFFPDAIILCDREGKILRMNAAALKLFEVSSQRLCQGVPYQQFLQHYEIRDERNQRISLGEWFLRLLLNKENSSSMQEHLLLLGAPSGRKISLNLRCSSLPDSPQHPVGMISVFHEITHQYQEALHLQRVREAVVTLTEAIAHIPAQVDFTVPEETFLLSPPIAFIAQHLVEVIGDVLGYYRLLLVAFEPPAGHLYYIASSGFTTEQEQQFRESRERDLLSDIADETVIARLQAGQEAIIPARHLFLPSGYPPSPERENDLLVPLFLEQQWMGVLGIAKDLPAYEYTRDEIELVQAVVTQAALIMECAHGLYKHAEARSRELMLDEAKRLSNNFLTLAAHELRTPLTTIKGNLQLAHRRLEALRRQLAEPSEQLAHVQHSLVAATQGTQLQERMIQDMLDDASIQTNHLELVLKPCDLLALVQETVARWHQWMPARTIELEISNTRQLVPIVADADRIKRVLNHYIENALTASSTQQPVIVRLEVEDAIARVAVQHEGTDIPLEEQERIWERSYRAKGSAIQHALDLSLGLGLYLCRVFIERHHGRVGVQSVPGQGATFWFTLPLVPTPRP
ncbi:MAG TPA: ATP-binding protein [Ktedonobacteraceae bacterium]